MITFIVTTYNLEKWLIRRCLDSIVAQGLAREEYEIIVVDDESIISPKHVVDEYTKQSNITLYVQKHNRQGAARNLALKYARGEWVLFVDGDDYLFRDTVGHLLKIAQDKLLDILMFGFRKVYQAQVEEGTSVFLDKMLEEPSTGNDYMYRHNLFGSCCMLLFRRELLNDSKYGAPLRFTEGIYIEDEEFVTRLVWRARRVMRVDVPVYAYYQRTGSTVHSVNREHTNELFVNYFIVLKRLIDFEASLAPMPHKGVTRKVRFLAVDVLRRSLRENDWKLRWNQSVQQLEALGLYPIPAERYSWKYCMFRLLVWCGIGRYLLRLLEKEI